MDRSYPILIPGALDRLFFSFLEVSKATIGVLASHPWPKTMCHDQNLGFRLKSPETAFKKNTILVRFYQLLGIPTTDGGVPEIGYPQINPQIIHV